jgi:hypothetical protein
MLDTSAWLRHLHRGDEVIDRFLGMRTVVGHPAVAGEVMLGCGAACRELALEILDLPWPACVDARDAALLADVHGLRCRGIGWADVQILLDCATCRPPIALLTLDRRMAAAARGLGIEVVSITEG